MPGAVELAPIVSIVVVFVLLGLCLSGMRFVSVLNTKASGDLHARVRPGSSSNRFKSKGP